MWNGLLASRLKSQNPNHLRETLSGLAQQGSSQNIEPLLLHRFSISQHFPDNEAHTLLRDALAGCARSNPQDLLPFIPDNGVDAYLLLDAYFAAGGPPEPVDALLRNEKRPLSLRERMASHIVELGRAASFIPLYRDWLTAKQRSTQVEALRGLNAADVPDIEELLLNALYRGDTRALRSLAAMALQRRLPMRLALETEARMVAAIGDASQIEALGVIVLSPLMEALAFRDDYVPKDIAHIENLIRQRSRDIGDAFLTQLAALPDPEYYSREFGSGHMDAGFGKADASQIRSLASAELTRRA